MTDGQPIYRAHSPQDCDHPLQGTFGNEAKDQVTGEFEWDTTTLSSSEDGDDAVQRVNTNLPNSERDWIWDVL